ncbi:putative arabinosyltransferase ARAD1 [Drosera capensis]
MGAMSEKSLPSSRFLLNLIAIAMLIVCVSSMFLYHCHVNPIIPTSVFNLIVINRPDSDVEYMDSPALHEAVSLVDDEIMVKETHMGSDQIEDVKAVADSLSPLVVDDHKERIDIPTSVNANKSGCDPRQAVLRVYMYDLPPEFHFGLLGWKGRANQIWPDGRLVEFLMSRHEWRRSKGKDHVLVAHHPNSMLYSRKKLGAAIFVLADFGRYPPKIANLRKDVIAPYKHVVRSVSATSSAPFEQRPILAYFQGAIYRKDGGAVRQELFYLLKDEKDVQFKFGSVHRQGIREASQGMAASKFCLNIAGDTPSSNRLFDSIVSHCVPVIISDQIELPFEDVLDYSKFSIFVRAADATKPGFLLNLLRGIKKEEWTSMWDRLKEVACHFEYQYPSQPEDAVDMIWRAIARKFSTVNSQPRKRRYRVPNYGTNSERKLEK